MRNTIVVVADCRYVNLCAGAGLKTPHQPGAWSASTEPFSAAVLCVHSALSRCNSNWTKVKRSSPVKHEMCFESNCETWDGSSIVNVQDHRFVMRLLSWSGDTGFCSACPAWAHRESPGFTHSSPTIIASFHLPHFARFCARHWMCFTETQHLRKWPKGHLPPSNEKILANVNLTNDSTRHFSQPFKSRQESSKLPTPKGKED